MVKKYVNEKWLSRQITWYLESVRLWMADGYELTPHQQQMLDIINTYAKEKQDERSISKH